MSLPSDTVRRDLPAPGRRRHREGVDLLKAALSLTRTRIGIAFIVFVVGVAVFGPYLAPHSTTQFVGAPLRGPTSAARLGTDFLGRDVLSRVLHGGRSTLILALLATAIGEVVGIFFGTLAGYSRRRVDETVMRTFDVVLAFPAIIFVLLVVAMSGPNPWYIAVAVGLTHVPAVARVSRGATLQVVKRDYVKAAEALGMSRLAIMRAEILPNITTPMLADLGIRFAYSVSIIAALSFLGFGLQPPAADWGLMINENRIGIVTQPWAVLTPIFLIAIATVGANLIADGLTRATIGLDRSMKAD